jgi:hypothetical protein
MTQPIVSQQRCRRGRLKFRDSYLVQKLLRDSWGDSATINRISSPELRAAILTYVDEKFAGLYDHNKTRER